MKGKLHPSKSCSSSSLRISEQVGDPGETEKEKTLWEDAFSCDSK